MHAVELRGSTGRVDDLRRDARAVWGESVMKPLAGAGFGLAQPFEGGERLLLLGGLAERAVRLAS